MFASGMKLSKPSARKHISVGAMLCCTELEDDRDFSVSF